MLYLILALSCIFPVYSQPYGQEYGGCWTEQVGSGSRFWTSIATSVDGQIMIAAENGEV
jgi:hypothetical protein